MTTIERDATDDEEVCACGSQAESLEVSLWGRIGEGTDPEIGRPLSVRAFQP